MPPRSEIGRRLDAVIGSDPRISDEYVRRIDGPDAPVVLVGVVHDHPASIYRVEQLIEALSPSTVAIELPGLLVPVISAAEQSDDGVGGEMAAAIAAADSTPVVGIDVPGLGTVRVLATELRSQNVRSRTVLLALKETWRLTSNAVLGRLAHAGVPRTPSVADLEFGHEYDLARDATPTAQADHEATHLRRSTTLLRTFEPPAAVRVVDDVRERHMAEQLSRLRVNGPVVGVVGYGHLDGIEAILGDKTG